MEILKSGRFSRTGGLILILASAVAVSLICTGAASAQTLTTLSSFNGSNGANPYAGLIADANGNLFGTTTSGGEDYGTVFEIANNSGVYAGTPTTLVIFNGSDGAIPYGGLIADANGNLFGTTFQGGQYGMGTVFEIANNSGIYANRPTTLVSFNGSNGANPYAGLIADAHGNLFGTTSSGGVGNGTVFEIVNNSGVYANTPTTLASFSGSNGAIPRAGLIADANGNLFGTTFQGGEYGGGTVFEIANNSGVYAATPTTLASFSGSGGDGELPYAGLIADANGNLFGTTFKGGEYNVGTVFEIANNSGVYANTPTTLASFGGSAGLYPVAGLIADANGNLFGTTTSGGVSGLGTVFELINNSGVYANTPITLASFNGSDGENPQASLMADANGNLFGTTLHGGVGGVGTVFELTGSGFASPKQFDGIPGAANCVGQSISAMAKTYGGAAHAAAALGYASVKDLQSAVSAYCGNN